MFDSIRIYGAFIIAALAITLTAINFVLRSRGRIMPTWATNVFTVSISVMTIAYTGAFVVWAIHGFH